MSVDHATDEELMLALGFETIDEMISSAAGKRGVLFIQTCDGQWMKYETDSQWHFNYDPESPEWPQPISCSISKRGD